MSPAFVQLLCRRLPAILLILALIPSCNLRTSATAPSVGAFAKTHSEQAISIQALNVDQLTALAYEISRRVSGVPVQGPELEQMVSHLRQNRLTEAARVATESGNFLSLMLPKVLGPLFHPQGSPKDGVEYGKALLLAIGLVRDNFHIGRIFHEYAWYRLRVPEIAGEQNPYEFAKRYNIDLRSALERVEGHPDGLPMVHTLGIYTLGQAARYNLDGGTNRRGVEALVSSMGKSMEQIRSARYPETQAYPGDPTWIMGVGPDVSRSPDGNGRTLFANKCLTCHGFMDYVRPIFCGIAGTKKQKLTLYSEEELVDFADPVATEGCQPKFRASGTAPDLAPGAYVPKTARWIIPFSSEQLSLYGWSGPVYGENANSLGQAWAQMTEVYRAFFDRVFKQVCPGGDVAGMSSFREEQALLLKKDGDLKRLFASLAVHPKCFGEIE